jgi:hypothetical protein
MYQDRGNVGLHSPRSFNEESVTTQYMFAAVSSFDPTLATGLAIYRVGESTSNLIPINDAKKPLLNDLVSDKDAEVVYLTDPGAGGANPFNNRVSTTVNVI